MTQTTAGKRGQSATSRFPADFVWGAQSDPVFSEGETVSDWAGFAGPDGSVPDDGPRHWRRYRYDFRSLSNLGFNAYRFGLDWARLQRKPYAPFSREERYRYLEMLAELRSLGIEPWLTLHHHALPRWAASRGGWLNPELPRQFADYAARVADLTDGEVVNWVTIHEPQFYAWSSRIWGLFPGSDWGRFGLAHKTLLHLRDAHRLAAAAVRRRLENARIGVSLPGGGYLPERAWHPGDRLVARLAGWLVNRARIGPFLGGSDFLMIGMRVVHRLRAGNTLSLTTGLAPRFAHRVHEGGEAAEKNRDARRSVIRKWRSRFSGQIYLVGSTPPDAADDPGLPGTVRDCLALASGETGRALGIAGFFYAPLLDQFSPIRGLAGGSGLLEVDFRDPGRRREVRGFAKTLAEVIRRGSLTEEHDDGD
ncbi:MAG: family 1 glycosylhydrolase [Planctomycetota bacterium]|jgi:beta-glucosidase|nr:family 1 glycosylhydrolase [Planctomycetota bacterium]